MRASARLTPAHEPEACGCACEWGGHEAGRGGTLLVVAATLLWIGVALDVGVLAGLFLRGRWREAWLLPAVILAALVSAATVGLYPAYNTWAFWLASEFAHILLLLLLGVELTVRVFPHGTRGRAAALTWVGLTVLAAASVASTSAGVDALPRLIASVLCLYTGLTLVMAAYGLSLGALHDALLYGFPCYLIVYVSTWGFTDDDTRLANLASPLAFDLMMLNLLCVAWQHEPHAQRPFALASQVRRLWHTSRSVPLRSSQGG